MIDLTNLRNITEQKANNAVAKQRHSELLLDNTQTQEIIVKSISKLVDFLDKKVTKTEVINQLRSVGTPDVQKVVSAVDSLHTTLKTHENTDLSGVTKVLTDLLEEAKKIPKELPKEKEEKFVDYSKQLTSLENTVKAVEKAIQGLELEVEAPVVNVPETQVNVEAPNLKPLEQSISSSSKDVVKAVKAIKIPELNTDPVEKLLKKTNKLLEELPELMPSGGGGSGSSWVAVDGNGIPVPIQLDAGAVPITGTIASSPVYSSGSTQSSVTVTNSNTTILASNVARLGATIYNEGTAVCYMKLGSSASTTSYTIQIASGGYYEIPFSYTAIITGITSASTAQLRITELT